MAAELAAELRTHAQAMYDACLDFRRVDALRKAQSGVDCFECHTLGDVATLRAWALAYYTPAQTAHFTALETEAVAARAVANEAHAAALRIAARVIAAHAAATTDEERTALETIWNMRIATTSTWGVHWDTITGEIVGRLGLDDRVAIKEPLYALNRLHGIGGGVADAADAHNKDALADRVTPTQVYWMRRKVWVRAPVIRI